MYGYIYKVINLVNNKIYIGQKKSTIFLGKKYLGSGQLIKKAIQKYGKQSFDVELLETCESKENLDSRERYWIRTLDAKNPAIGYNIAEGGQCDGKGIFTGCKHSEETKRKISRSVSITNEKLRKGKKMTDLVGPNYINGMKGKPAANKGKIRIYNPELDKVKYITADDPISNYPGFIFGGPSRNFQTLNLSYLEKPEYQKQLRERNKDTKFLHNDLIRKCIRVKAEKIEEFLNTGWKLGRKAYK